MAAKAKKYETYEEYLLTETTTLLFSKIIKRRPFIQGLLNPIRDMVTNITETFSPYYKEDREVKTKDGTKKEESRLPGFLRDLKQPAHAIANITLALGLAIIWLPKLFIYSIWKGVKTQSLGTFFKTFLELLLLEPVQILAVALRGITQLLALPFWIPKMIFRGILTGFAALGLISDKPETAATKYEQYVGWNNIYGAPEIKLGDTGNVFRNIKKDFVDTFKPYKSSYYIKRDLSQPVRGLANIGLAFGLALLWPVKLVFHSIDIGLNRGFLAFLTTFFRTLVVEPFQILAIALRGVTQLLTSVALPLRLIVRGCITAWQGWRMPENSSLLNQKLQEARTDLQTLKANSAYTAYAKLLKEEKQRGQENYSKPQDESLQTLCKKASDSYHTAFKNYIKNHKKYCEERGGLRLAKVVTDSSTSGWLTFEEVERDLDLINPSASSTPTCKV